MKLYANRIRLCPLDIKNTIYTFFSDPESCKISIDYDPLYYSNRTGQADFRIVCSLIKYELQFQQH